MGEIIRQRKVRRILQPFQKKIKIPFRRILQNGGDKKSEAYQKSLTENLPQAISVKERNPTTDKKLSDIAGISEKTYRMGAKVLNSDNVLRNLKGFMELNMGGTENQIRKFRN